MSNEYKDWLHETAKEVLKDEIRFLKQSRIDYVGQNGNDGLHYLLSTQLEEYIFNMESGEDKEFLNRVLIELKSLEKKINILTSDKDRLQQIAWNKANG